MKRWRIIPEFRLVDYKAGNPSACEGIFKSWFYVKLFWGGRLVFVGVRHWCLQLDFRRNWISDIIGH